MPASPRKRIETKANGSRGVGGGKQVEVEGLRVAVEQMEKYGEDERLRDQIEDLMTQVSLLETRLLEESEQRERLEEGSRMHGEIICVIEKSLQAWCKELLVCQDMVSASEMHQESICQEQRALCDAETRPLQLQISRLEAEVSRRFFLRHRQVISDSP